MTFPAAVRIREVGPREGFQTLSASVPTEQKLALITALGKTGVKDIELTSFVRPDRVPQMADAEQVVNLYEQVKGVNYTALYLNKKGFHRAEKSGRLNNEGWLYIAASETFLKRNNNLLIVDVLNAIPEWITLFGEYNKSLQGLMISAAFGCNAEGEIPPAKVLEIIKAVLHRIKDLGATLPEVCLADTMGWATPDKLKKLIAQIKKLYPELLISLHLHDTRGMGIANVYAGLCEGVSCIDASVGGLGGCPFAKGSAGNVATEEVVYLCNELGIKTGIDLRKYIVAARIAEEIADMPLPGKLHRMKQSIHATIRSARTT